MTPPGPGSPARPECSESWHPDRPQTAEIPRTPPIRTSRFSQCGE